MNNKRWLRYGLVGNFLTYGIGVGFMAYLGSSFINKDGLYTILAKINRLKWTRIWQNNYLLFLMLN